MRLIVICGATATGKSALSIALARELNAEIINADSMQVYRGMDIGTAKLSIAEREGIEHHLIDIVDVSQDSSVAWFQSIAREKISQIHAQGRDVIIVGGTGLYIKSILDDLDFPETNPEIRNRLIEEADLLGGEKLFQRLEELDPEAAAAIDRKNLRRVIRALEVIELTGAPYAAKLPRQESSRYPQALQFGLVLDREHLRERIDTRVDQMWEKGFVSEVESLVNQGIKKGTTAKRAIGYKQILNFLEGEMSESEAKEETKRATRQYARRQETWFSRDSRIRWIAPHQPHLEKVLEAINSPQI